MERQINTGKLYGYDFQKSSAEPAMVNGPEISVSLSLLIVCVTFGRKATNNLSAWACAAV